MDWQTHKQLLLKKPAFAREYQALEPEFQIARSVIEARILRGLTQQQLAQKLKTRQSVISRLESGQSAASLSLLKRLATALETTFTISIPG